MSESDVILVRALTLHVGGLEHAIIVKILRPKPDPLPGGDWGCEFCIEGIPNTPDIKRTTFGIDPMQAAILTLQRVRAELRLLAADGLELRWLGMTDLGFPNLAESEPSVEELSRLNRRSPE